MIEYLKENLVKGFSKNPFKSIHIILAGVLVFSVPVLPFGFSAGLFAFSVIDPVLLIILPFTMFVFPALLEEVFFRGLFIPPDSMDRGIKYSIRVTLLSSTLFTLWHPLNAVTINPGAKQLFLDPFFLVITFWLGIICSVSYILSRSVWVPIVIHWIVVVFWVAFLSGRNLVLE